jgi:tetratricopeptide (TPR) repeat protein
MKRVLGVALVCAAVWACPFDQSLREYLSVSFWSPFAKRPAHFEKPNIKRVDVAYAGMGPEDNTPLGRLRSAYRRTTHAPQDLAAARADALLSAKDREEAELIDAKIDLRLELPSAKAKFDQFLKTAKTPEWVSEARGWQAHLLFNEGNYTAAGKIYLDELNRNGSNLSRKTLLDSLQLTYEYDGGSHLYEHLEEYFDTPEHAVFAIGVVTNPRQDQVPDASTRYKRVNELVTKHRSLLRGNALALHTMRTALRMGDPGEALKIASMVPEGSSVRTDPDFLWMQASAYFVTRDYANAEAPLLAMFQSLKEEDSRKAAAAYGLCGVYQKLNLPAEQIRFALWAWRRAPAGWDGARVSDLSIYWAPSGFDLSLLLDFEAPDQALQEFLQKYPGVRDVRLVKYALAVRMAREDRYEDAAEIYDAIGQKLRGPRMRELARLQGLGTAEGKYQFAEFLGAHNTGVYFNDSLWGGYQNYALLGESEFRFTKEERAQQIARERQLRDQQEERWRAYLILRDVMREEGHTELGTKAARLALRNLRKISDRFGRQEDIRRADRETSAWLRAR